MASTELITAKIAKDAKKILRTRTREYASYSAPSSG